MRKLFVILAVLSLNGCAVWDAFFMTGFDPNEYRVITEIRTDANAYKAQCSDSAKSKLNAMAISHKTMLFQYYEEQIPKNKNGYNASVELNKIAQGLKDRYNLGAAVPDVFCKLKFEGIEHSADLMAHVLGKRPR